MADRETKLIITADNTDAVKKIEEFSGSLDGVKTSSEKVGKSQENLTESVFKGQAAWDLMKQGISTVSGFVMEGIEAFNKASEEMAIVKTNVENAGMAWEEVGPKLQAYSKNVQQLGFDDEDTSKSVSKLLLITGNYNQALALNSLAMDLARNRGISLETATTSLAQVIQGQGARALTQYGLTFKDGASSAEILVELQDKLKNSAADFANSTGGKLEIINLQWEEMKKKMGEELAPEVIKLADLFQKYMPAVEIALGAVVFTVDKLVDSITYVTTAAEEFGNVLGTGLTVEEQKAKEMTDDMVNSTQNLVLAYNKHHQNAKITINDLAGIAYGGTATKKEMDLLKEATHDFNIEQSKIPSGESALAGVQGKAATAATAITDLKDKYNTATQKISDDLTTLEQNHKDKMDSIKDSITKTKQSLQDLEDAYNQTKTSDTQSVADKIVASEQKVADLQKQINESTSDTQRAQLQKDLADEQKNLASASQWKIDNVAAISEAERRAGETDLQRTIEDYLNKRILADKDYQEKKARLAQELLDLDDNNKKEIQMYADKVAKISEQLAKETADFKKNMADQRASAEASINAQIDMYNRLAAAKAAAGLAAAALAHVTSTTVPVSGARASGGPVGAGEAYVVGENGPEVFVPSNSGGIVPNNKLGGGGNVTINISMKGPFYTERDMAIDLGNQIALEIQRQIRI